MKMKDIRDIHVKIRNKYSPNELKPEILTNIIHIIFEYLSENNQPDRLRRVDTSNSEAIVGSANIDEIAELNRND